MSGKLKTLPPRYQPGFLREMDGRSAISQRLNALYEVIVADAGGEETLAHTKLALVERFVFLEAALQTWERAITEDPKASEQLLGRWIQGVNSLQGLAKMIGLERQLRLPGGLRAYVEDRA